MSVINTPTGKKAIAVLKYCFGISVFIYVALRIDYKSFDFSSIGFGYLALSFIPLALFIFLQGMRFNSLLAHPLKNSEVFPLQFILQFFNLVFPGGLGGDVYRVYILKHAEDSVFSLAGKSIVDRLSGLLVITAMFVWSLYSVPIKPEMQKMMLTVSVLAVIIVLVICGVMLARYWSGSALIKRGFTLVAFSGGCWAAQIFRIWLLCLAIGLNFSMAETAFMLGVLQLASLLPVTIGGLGIVEGAFVFAAGALGTALPLAALGAVLMRITTMVSGSLGFLLWLRGKRHDS